MLLLLFLAAPSRAAEPLRLEEGCRIAADASVQLPAALPRLDRCEGRAPKDHIGTIWVDYPRMPTDLTVAKTWRLVLDNHVSSAVDVWLIGSKGPAQHYRYDPNAPDREWAAGNYLSMLVSPERPISRIVVRLADARSHTYVRAPKIARARYFVPIERDQASLYGIGVGMLALTILFHLSLFVAMRRRFQLYYCAHVGLLLIYGLSYSGIIHILWPSLTAAQNSALLGFSMTAATATGIGFVIEFLGNSTPVWLRRWAAGGAFASIAAAVVGVIVPESWSYALYMGANVIALHAILLTAGIVLRACAVRVPMASAIALAWAAPMTVSLMYPARTFGLIGDGALLDGLMMFAATIECLILSLPVASRIRNLRIEHERAHERHVMLERQAQTDALTGLANRRGFGEALARAAAGHGEPMPIALLVIDIDHFKRVNDQHGHATGDAILRHVAAHVARVAGAGAIVARHGGEEFVVALRNHDLMRAGTIAERIRVSMGVTFDTEPALPSVTVSIGVAAGFSDEVETILADADCALYRAKNEGRNKVMLADGPLMYAAAA
ncbi:diguanylate cyclase [Sphingomonas sp. MAH-20]|uniref:diguanylate cyclase n=1 Tax=Sphingomonas horti TaxID=2682842 RepID=A0A6I4IY22_9SPHN|nr:MULTISPECIES: diguanylate cyclase [Sphingomonas]MBA2918130.1 diguanylate cyclase [Sphingomonas sp. CGMCC 1.13658]MVO77100.1 diguanylate cyclase [Sphingomonas horti]